MGPCGGAIAGVVISFATIAVIVAIAIDSGPSWTQTTSRLPERRELHPDDEPARP